MKKIILIVSSILVLAFSGCGKGVELGSVVDSEQGMSRVGIAENQLYSVDITSEEEAKKVAEQYGIEFVEYVEGVATFHTDKDPQSVVQYGIDNGYVTLYINYIVEALDE